MRAIKLVSKCVISLRTQTVNLGDYLILNACIRYLSNKYELVILDTKGVPASFALAVKEQHADLVENGKVILKSLSPKYYLFNKFDFFRKAGACFIRASIKNKVTYVLRAVYNYLRRALRLGNAYYFPISISGRISFPSRLFLKSFKHIFVRDLSSRDTLINHGVKTVTLVPDMAFYDYKNGEKDKKQSSHADGLTILASFRHDRSPSKSQLCKHLNFYPNAKLVGLVSQVLFDIEVNSSLAKELNLTHESVSIDNKGMIKINNIYSENNIVISNRLHVLLMAMLQGAIPIPFLGRDDHKVKAYFDSLGLASIFYDDEMTKDQFDKIFNINSACRDFGHLKLQLENALDSNIIIKD